VRGLSASAGSVPRSKWKGHRKRSDVCEGAEVLQISEKKKSKRQQRINETPQAPRSISGHPCAGPFMTDKQKPLGNKNQTVIARKLWQTKGKRKNKLAGKKSDVYRFPLATHRSRSANEEPTEADDADRNNAMGVYERILSGSPAQTAGWPDHIKKRGRAREGR
jgi:hypothetical protein